VSATRPSLVRRALLPSRLEEPAGPTRIDSFGRLRALFALLAVGLDVGIYLSFSASPRFDAQVVRAFALINIPLLTAVAALSWFGLRRRHRFYDALVYLSITIEVCTAMVYIQITGSVSSYFVVVIPVLTLIYRFFLGYRQGVAVLAVGIVAHGAIMVMEELGVLRQAPLFTDGTGGLYAVPAYRLATLMSIYWLWLGTFIVANYISVALREKEEQLDVAQKNLERVAAEVQPGRLSGQILDDKWALGELLGRGGMGEVYQAMPLHGGPAVAVKVLYQHLCEPDGLQRFKREAELANRLPAARVARVIDIGHATEGGHHYMVMELLSGEDLATLLRRRTRLPGTELVPLIEQLAAALDDAHAAGIVHRDLKPQNVFLSTTAEAERVSVKLLDFGVARMLGGGHTITGTAMVLGSPGYLAPEQAVEHLGEVSARTDVFALGAIIYRALTGQHAFPSRHPAAAIYEAVHVEPIAPSAAFSDLSSDVDTLLAIAMAKHPADRFASAGELARELPAALAGRLDDTVRARAGRVARAGSSSPELDRTLTDLGTPQSSGGKSKSESGTVKARRRLS
jgi:serine/threonine protein kinase